MRDMVSDVLVIGSGVAGLSFALKMADYSHVVLVTKKGKAESNTNYAQGGLAAVLSPDDSFESHINDTLVCGDGLCDRDVVEHIVRAAPACIKELEEMGAGVFWMEVST